MRDVATPMRSPISVHTPKAFHSIKFLMWYSLFIMYPYKVSDATPYEQIARNNRARIYKMFMWGFSFTQKRMDPASATTY